MIYWTIDMVSRGRAWLITVYVLIVKTLALLYSSLLDAY
jgi:hypothetical protein